MTVLEDYRKYLTTLSEADLDAERTKMTDEAAEAMERLRQARGDAERAFKYRQEVQIELLSRIKEEDPPF